MTAALADVLAAALRRRVSGTDDDIRRLAESLLADGPLADRLEQAAADARQPFLDLADQYARDPIIGCAIASAIRAAAATGGGR
jgi:hypothetical protein